MTPRPYQQAALTAIQKHRDGGGKSGVVVVPTAGGKSLLISKFCEMRPHERVLVLCHQSDILSQNAELIGEHSIYCAGLGSKDLGARVVLASRDSLSRLKSLPKFDSIIVDEAHLVSSKEESGYQKIIDLVKPSYLLGLTATPYRLDGGEIFGNGKQFESKIYQITMAELVESGYLVDFVLPTNAAAIDRDVLKKRSGQFTEESQEAAFSRSVVDDCIHKWEVLAADRKLSLFFCCSVEHAKLVQSLVQKSILITGETKDRDVFIDSARRGDIRAIINVNVLTTGVNIPSIDCVVFLRATASASLYTQSLGRGLRTHPHKQNCLILDFAGNYQTFGHPDNPTAPYKRASKSVDESAIEEMLDGLLGPIPIVKQGATKACKSCKLRWPVAKRKCSCGELFLSHGSNLGTNEIEIESFKITEKTFAASGNMGTRIDYKAVDGTVIVEWFMDSQCRPGGWQFWPKQNRLKQLKQNDVRAIEFKMSKCGKFKNVVKVLPKPKSKTQLLDS